MSAADASAVLRYLVPGVERPIYHASLGGADAAMRIGAKFEDRELIVRDARQLENAPELDREGFTLRAHDSGVADFYALERERERYEAAIVALVCGETGAVDAMVFDHTLRSDSRSVRGARQTREPASVIHNDYTDASAARRLEDLLSAGEAAQRLARRYAIVNIWRPLVGPVLNSPLACCDATTLSAQDLVASERRAQDRVGELELVIYSPRHRWFYYPEMQPNEVLLIKTFDTARDGRARRSIHTAFDNPLAPPGSPPRESIESRLLVFF